jgi:hypothetical protein
VSGLLAVGQFWVKMLMKLEIGEIQGKFTPEFIQLQEFRKRVS